MAWNKRNATYLLYAIVLFFPFSVKLCNACILLLLANWIIGFRSWNFKGKTFKILLLMLPFLLSCVSLLYTENMKEGVRLLEKGLPFLVFPLVFGSMSQLEFRDRNRLLNFTTIIFAISIAVYIVNAILTFSREGNADVFFWKKLTDPFSFHPTYLSIVIVFLFAHVVFHWIDNPAKTNLIVPAVLLLFTVSLVLLSSKLQIILFFLLCLFLLARFIYRKGFSRFTMLAISLSAIVVFGILRSPGVRDRFSHVSSMEYQLDAPVETFNELTIRFALFDCAWRIIKNNLAIGVGVGDVDNELLKVYYDVDYKFGYLDGQNPHNQYLSTTLATGMIGLLSLLIMFGYCLRHAIIVKDFPYLVFLTLFAVTFLVESMLERQKGIVFFTLFNALAIFHNRGEKKPMVI